MAAVRARRGRGAPQDPPPRKRRRAPPPPPAGGMPRLAQIKLSGGITNDDVNVSGKSLLVAVGGMVLFVGIAIAGATWLGSSLFDAREAFARSADSTVASVGFAADDIRVNGVSGARAAEVRAMVVPEDRESLLSLDPIDVKARVESLDWVASVSVQRLWPSTMVINVQRRQAYARWQEDGEMTVIDANGERLLAERAVDHPELPLVVGAGAGPSAEPLLIALENLPRVRARLEALVRVSDRRWNMLLQSGATVALPEQGAPQALARLETLQERYDLLDRPVAVIDMRNPGRMAVRVHPMLAGGPRGLLGGA
jgi:cell division protein FtsQ